MSGELKTDRTEGRQMLREMLSRKQDETRRRINDLRRDQEQESDEIDSARTTGDIETHAGLIALAEEKLKHLGEAMARLDQGKYGSCLKCAGAIPFERLMAIPFASYCVDCQKNLNREEGRWGHAPYDHQWTASMKSGEKGAGRKREVGSERLATTLAAICQPRLIGESSPTVDLEYVE